METLGDYAIQKHLGEGLFGTSYLAEHRFIKKSFVLKVLPEEISRDPLFIRRFEKEVAEIAKLDHPHIAKIHNVSFADGFYFLVTEPIIDSNEESMHLERYLRLKGKALSEEEKESLLRQIAESIDHAHSKGVFHGGIKLTNILMTSLDGKVSPLLIDFSLSRLFGENLFFSRLFQKIGPSFSTRLSEQGVREAQNFLTSLSFLAPEQKKLGSTIDEKVDSFAFGVLAYYVLMGKIPEGAFDPPSRAFSFKKNWDLLINRCLQCNGALRPQKLLLAMDEYLQAPRTLKGEVSSLEEVEKAVENVHQMAFQFQEKEKEPKLAPQEIKRPEFDPDPGAIFQREMQVSLYALKEEKHPELKPLLTEMVIIPAGSYMRGSGDGARDEMPRHSIKLSSFALDIHSVTNEQFVRFLEVMGGEKDEHNNDIIRLRDARIKRSAGKLTIESGYAKHPVVGVTWYGALAYAKWVGKRLPTEAEWEAAASSGRDGFIYPTGADMERSQANFFSSDTTAVMSYPPNGFGLYDMAGNVYEWCQDWYAYNYYDTSVIEPEEPKGPHQGVYRVLRGGCWKSLKDDLRVSHRHRNNPGAVNGTYGFRLAANVF